MSEEYKGEMPHIEGMDLLPAWFVGRLADDVWPIGLMCVGNVIINIDGISRVYQAADGKVWLDGSLADVLLRHPDYKSFSGLCSRKTVSINTSHIICACEAADT